MLDELVEIVIVEVVQPEVFAVGEKVHAGGEMQVRIEFVEFWNKVAGKEDVGNRDYKCAASISGVVVRSCRVHSAKLGDGCVERFENLNIS